MRTSIWIWAVCALIVITLPFNPVLNRPMLALVVLVAAAVVSIVALDHAIRHDMVDPHDEVAAR